MSAYVPHQTVPFVVKKWPQVGTGQEEGVEWGGVRRGQEDAILDSRLSSQLSSNPR